MGEFRSSGASTPKNLDIDGVGLALLFNGKERRKDHFSCWYHRNADRKKATQHTRNQSYKRHASRKFHDIVEDPLKRNDLDANGVPRP